MNGTTLALCGALLSGGLIQLVANVFLYGKLTQKVADHEDTLLEHAKMLAYQGEKLNTHAIQLGKLESWREGYNAATAAKKGDG